jgi:hypothetical protein
MPRWKQLSIVITVVALVAVTRLGFDVSAKEPAASLSAEKIKFKHADGRPAFSLKTKDDGVKLLDGQEHELARFTWTEGKLKIKDPADAVIGYIVIHDQKLHLEAADQKHRLFSLARQPDGDWKFEDSAGMRLATLKHRDYGYEVEDAQQASLYKAKKHGAKTSLRNKSDETVYYTDEPIAPAAVACLGLERITDLRLQMALAVAVERHEHH